VQADIDVLDGRRVTLRYLFHLDVQLASTLIHPVIAGGSEAEEEKEPVALFLSFKCFSSLSVPVIGSDREEGKLSCLFLY
jgi:hypothetical protein